MNKILYISSSLLCIGLLSCGGRPTSQSEQNVDTATPVTVTCCTVGAMQETVEVSATSAFLQKSYIKATTNGYLKSVSTQLGQRVVINQVLFTLQAKEAASLGTTLNVLDSTLNFSGITKISANGNGFITQILHQSGDYVLEGDQLAEISDLNSLVFIMQLPYELNSFLPMNRTIDLELPDGKVLRGAVSSAMPMVDPISQTQSIVIKINNSDGSIPENLIAKVRFVKSRKNDAVSLPKAAILTDETQEHFWIMKMKDKETAVKVPIKKGVESAGMIEVVSPKLSSDDIILETGNYGLPDTAKVIIQQ